MRSHNYLAFFFSFSVQPNKKKFAGD